jgi:nucleoside-diphosphate-sugar epimerase
MRDAIFVTGGSGFVGRTLLAALQPLGRPVIALARREMPHLSGDAITVVQGDLLDPATYADALRSCEVVIHLAATTGRASAEEHLRVNAHGTSVLIDACRKAGVPKVLFVSSIATTFPDKTGYHYALAKCLAEEAVARSGLRFAILRPTAILGPAAPVLGGLEKLALLPFIVMPGAGRVRVQPIHVNDVARCITETVRQDLFTDATVEIGGPDTFTMEGLLQHIRVARTGRSGRVVHVPLPALRIPLRMAEAMGLGGLLPISAGQLSSFRFDGVAASHPLHERLGSSQIGITQMVPSVSEADRAADAGLASDAPGAECRVFTQHLLGRDPDDYVTATYRAALAEMPVLSARGRFDEALLSFARIHPLYAKVADAYASVFLRAGALRKRLVLLLAILETRPPFSEAIDQAVGGSMPVLFIRLGARTAAALVSLLVGTLIFTPTRIVLAMMGKGAP